MKVGYFLACEEFGPRELVDQARRAEEAGFHGLWISDHYHPWNDQQGHSPFVWSVIGALSEATGLPVTTGVTCPTVRIHPAIIAQAAATSAVMHQGRFSLGVGSGEALNEHILGDRWPEADARLEMLEEAVEVIRLLWQGGQQSHHGRHYTVENARVYDLPDGAAADPRLRLRSQGDRSRCAGSATGSSRPRRTRRRLTGTGPPAAQGPSTPVRRSVHGRRRRGARDDSAPVAKRGPPGELAQLLPTPAHFEQACELVTGEHIASPAGPDLEQHVESLRQYADAGVDELYIQQIGPEQKAFFTTWAREVLPQFH